MNLGRPYSVSFENVAVTAAQDLFEISPADDKPVAITGLYLDNVGGTADAGDAQEELLRLLIRRGHTVSGSGGSAPTPRPLSPFDAAAGFAAETNNTTIANTGTTNDLLAFGWNVRIPGRDFWPEGMMFLASQQDTTIVVRLLSTVNDSINLSGTLFVAELI